MSPPPAVGGREPAGDQPEPAALGDPLGRPRLREAERDVDQRADPGEPILHGRADDVERRAPDERRQAARPTPRSSSSATDRTTPRSTIEIVGISGSGISASAAQTASDVQGREDRGRMHGPSYPGTTWVLSGLGRHQVAAGSSRRTEVISTTATRSRPSDRAARESGTQRRGRSRSGKAELPGDRIGLGDPATGEIVERSGRIPASTSASSPGSGAKTVAPSSTSADQASVRWPRATASPAARRRSHESACIRW